MEVISNSSCAVGWCTILLENNCDFYPTGCNFNRKQITAHQDIFIRVDTTVVISFIVSKS